MDKPKPQSLEEIRKDREQVYGPFQNNMASCGKMITGLLEQHYQIKLPHDVPGHMVALIMVAVKLNRAATPFKENNDNYVDARNYLDIAHDCDPRFESSKEVKRVHISCNTVAMDECPLCKAKPALTEIIFPGESCEFKVCTVCHGKYS